ncbi:rhodanese-like domain-containing protein, partial [Sporofaciens musculi]|uniref:rhodanese-like domain-containing protein n=1 Tax=Sporofaciens musculi TaxID=2681861 RepID=UPI00259CD50C
SKGLLRGFHLDELLSLPKDGSVTLLDVRTEKEYEHGHIDSFLNIPVDELRKRFSALDSQKPVYVICQSGLRSYIACRILAGNGYTCYNFSGGFRFYDAVINDRCLIESAHACGMDQ